MWKSSSVRSVVLVGRRSSSKHNLRHRWCSLIWRPVRVQVRLLRQISSVGRGTTSECGLCCPHLCRGALIFSRCVMKWIKREEVCAGGSLT